jgi:hypothetical protein
MDEVYRSGRISAAGHRPGTEDRLRFVTSVYVFSMVCRGWDAEAIRSRLLALAKGVIQDLADDEYKAETHIAIVQRTVDDLLRKLLEAPSEGSEDACPSR